MKEQSFTQVDLAERIGVTQAAVSKWINGTVPKGDQLLAVAQTLGVDMEWLLTGKKAPSPLELLRLAIAETNAGVQTPLSARLEKVDDEIAALKEIVSAGGWNEDLDAQFVAMMEQGMESPSVSVGWTVLRDFIVEFFDQIQSMKGGKNLAGYIAEEVPMLRNQLEGFGFELERFIERVNRQDPSE